MSRSQYIPRRVSFLFAAILLANASGQAFAGAAPAAPASGTSTPMSAGTSSPLPAPAPEPSSWEFRDTLYGWLSNVSADVRADGETEHFAISVADVLPDLRFIFSDMLEARYKRFVFLLDTYYLRLHVDESEGPIIRTVGPLTIQQGPVQLNIPRIDIPIGPIDINTTSNTTFVDAKLGYRLLSRDLSGSSAPSSGSDRRELVVDLLGGARYWYLRNTVEITVPPIQVPGFNIQPSIPAFPDFRPPGHPIFPGFGLPPIHVRGVTFGGVERKVTATSNWADPLLGMRIRADVTKRLSLTALGDVGGFGIGSASDVTWQGTGIVGFRFSNHWSVVGGYRVLGVSREGADVVLFGPVVGVSVRF